MGIALLNPSYVLWSVTRRESCACESVEKGFTAEAAKFAEVLKTFSLSPLCLCGG